MTNDSEDVWRGDRKFTLEEREEARAEGFRAGVDVGMERSAFVVSFQSDVPEQQVHVHGYKEPVSISRARDPRMTGMEDILATLENPGTHPIGAPGSLMRKAYDMGVELRTFRNMPKHEGCWNLETENFRAKIRDLELENMNLDNARKAVIDDNEVLRARARVDAGNLRTGRDGWEQANAELRTALGALRTALGALRSVEALNIPAILQKLEAE